MVLRSRWRRRGRRGIAEVVSAILLVALTVVAGTILWTFRFHLPEGAPILGYTIQTARGNPAWGDPTDCQPRGWQLSQYPLTAGQQSLWASQWLRQCYPPYVTGNFSLMNTSEITIQSHSPANIPLSELYLQFICFNNTSTGGRTVLLAGSLDTMTWFPGISSSPAANAPTLGYCGNFNARNYGGGAYGTLYNRLGMFIPISNRTNELENGDSFLLYLHTGGWPIDFECVTNLYGCLNCPQPGHCPPGYSAGRPEADWDDYHGAPPWCFTRPGACMIYITYTGYPGTTVASVDVSRLANL
jgi:flagellin-like protein